MNGVLRIILKYNMHYSVTFIQWYFLSTNFVSRGLSHIQNGGSSDLSMSISTLIPAVMHTTGIPGAINHGHRIHEMKYCPNVN